MRNLSQLKAECEKNGIDVRRAGKREAKSDYESALAKFYWERDHGSEPMPPQLHPMLARNLKDVEPDLARHMWESKRYAAQEKINGCRLLMFIGPLGNTFTSRRLSDKNYRYSENSEQITHLSHLIINDLVGTVLDGEIKCPKDRVNTGATITENELQATVALLALNPKDSERVQREQDCQLVYKVFDILQDRGQDITHLPLRLRQAFLVDACTKICAIYPDVKIELLPLVTEDKEEFYNKIVANGGEGIMLKDVEAPYEASSSRTKAMHKVKRFEEEDGFVTGFALGDEGAGWELLVGKLEISAVDTNTNNNHAIAMVSNLTFEDRSDATVCPICFKPLAIDWINDNGKRVVRGVSCLEHGIVRAILNPTWMGRVYQVKGQEWTSRVFRLKHAVIVSQRFDKTPETCTIDLVKIRAKFDAKGDETGVQL